MVFSDLVIIRRNMEQSTINCCTTGAIRSVLQRNRVKQNLEITKIIENRFCETRRFRIITYTRGIRCFDENENTSDGKIRVIRGLPEFIKS